MLFSILTVATFIAVLYPIAALVGHPATLGRWVHNWREYLTELAWSLLWAAGAVCFIAAYIWIFGMPEPE